jgi:hypothetical protein
MSASSLIWLSAYIYYYPPYEGILKAVKRLARGLYGSGAIESYFFIRYWENGPHIRLRLKCSPAKKAKLKEILNGYFKEYFKSHPSEAPGKTAPTDIPNNSLRYVKYEPETERYGGPEALHIAEELFYYSSRAALDIISKNKYRGYTDSLSAAIQLHVSLVKSFRIPVESIPLFFDMSCNLWISKTFMDPFKVIAPKTYMRRKAGTLKIFAGLYEAQKENLILFVKTLWECLSPGNMDSRSAVYRWYRDTFKIYKALNALNENGKLKMPPLAFKHEKQVSNTPIWYILDSYIHMINNRLGVSNQDEAYISYILKEIFKETGASLKYESRIQDKRAG